MMALFAYVSATGLARIDFTNLKCFISGLGLILGRVYFMKASISSLPETVKSSLLADIQSYDDSLSGYISLGQSPETRTLVCY